MTRDNLTPEQIERRRQASLTHGAYSYLARLRDGEPITPAMAELERSIAQELDADGPVERIRKLCIKFGVAQELRWGAMFESREAFEAGERPWGWHAGNEIRALEKYAMLISKGDGGPSAGDVLDAVKGKEK